MDGSARSLKNRTIRTGRWLHHRRAIALPLHFLDPLSHTNSISHSHSHSLSSFLFQALYRTQDYLLAGVKLTAAIMDEVAAFRSAQNGDMMSMKSMG